MSEYIERGKAFAILRDASKQNNTELDKAKIAFAMVFLCQQPAADVEPVVRGEFRINDQGYLECSACGKTLRMPLTSTYEMKRCYTCGARIERSGSGE